MNAAAATCFAVLTLSLSACGDDTPSGAPVSDQKLGQQVKEACARQGGVRAHSGLVDNNGHSDNLLLLACESGPTRVFRLDGFELAEDQSAAQAADVACKPSGLRALSALVDNNGHSHNRLLVSCESGTSHLLKLG